MEVVGKTTAICHNIILMQTNSIPNWSSEHRNGAVGIKLYGSRWRSTEMNSNRCGVCLRVDDMRCGAYSVHSITVDYRWISMFHYKFALGAHGNRSSIDLSSMYYKQILIEFARYQRNSRMYKVMKGIAFYYTEVETRMKDGKKIYIWSELSVPYLSIRHFRLFLVALLHS